jgi:hypothetical protein
VYCVTMTTGGGARVDGEDTAGGIAEEATGCCACVEVGATSPSSESFGGVGLGTWTAVLEG